MSMPKATMNKNDFLSRSKDKVRTTGKIFSMEAVSVAERMNKTSDDHFWRGIFIPNLAHYFTTFLRRYRIH